MQTSTKAISILLESGAVRISTTHPQRHPSGLLSPFIPDTLALSGQPAVLNTLLDVMIQKIATRGEAFDVVAAADTASLFLATLLAERLGKPMVYLRPKPKAHGKQKQIEGSLPAGARTLLLFESVLTDQAIDNARAVLEASGATLTGAFSLVANDLAIPGKGAPGRLRHDSLAPLSAVLQAAVAQGRIPAEARQEIEAWARAPEDRWAQDIAASARRRQEASARREHHVGMRRRVANALLAIDAVSINADQPFLYASGLLSPIYTDNRLLISHPKQWDVIIEAYAETIRDVLGRSEVDGLVGMVTSGIPHASRLCAQFGLPLVYVTSEGGEDQIHGRIGRAGGTTDRLVIIEDHVTTGRSVLATADVLREHGAVIDWCIAIFTYDADATRAAFARRGLSLATLCDLPTLLDVAIETGRISAEERDAVQAWAADPRAWSDRERARRQTANATPAR